MEAIKEEPKDESEDIVLSHPYDAKQTIDQIRMTFRAAIQRIDINVKSETESKTRKRQLTEEELDARRRINRIRMAATRAGRTLEQIESDRMSQRARMAALRRRRSEQGVKSVLGDQETASEDNGEELTNKEVVSEQKVRRTPSTRRHLTPEELEIRRRINRLRVAMMRAERTEEQIEADRKAQRLRMAELRRRRTEEQIAADLESQRARMAALRRERRRLREESLSMVVADGGCTALIKQEVDEEATAGHHHPPFTPYPRGGSDTHKQDEAAAAVRADVGTQEDAWKRRLALERRHRWRVQLSPEEDQERKRRAAERMRLYRAALRETLSPEELQERRWKAAERMRAWRASLTQEELARMRAKGLERARRWRAERNARGRGRRELTGGVGMAQGCSAQACTVQDMPERVPGAVGWEKLAGMCMATQEQGITQSASSAKDCTISPYFSTSAPRNCGCTSSHWPSAVSAIGGSSLVDPYANNGIPVSLAGRVSFHAQSHAINSVPADVGGAGAAMSHGVPVIDPVMMPCIQPPVIAPVVVVNGVSPPPQAFSLPRGPGDWAHPRPIMVSSCGHDMLTSNRVLQCSVADAKWSPTRQQCSYPAWLSPT